jgi:fused signal recognition particle receptor
LGKPFLFYPAQAPGKTTEQMSFFKRLFSSEKKENLNQGLEKTRTGFLSRITKAIAGKSRVDEEVLDNLEEVLISSDVGVETTLRIIRRIEERVSRNKYLGTDELNGILREEIAGLLAAHDGEDSEDIYIPTDKQPYVIMVVGVNGVGKTTTIGKLAFQLNKQGKKVVLGAADTFRAAAVDQIKIWGERANVPVVSQGMGADPSNAALEWQAGALGANLRDDGGLST